MGKRYFCDYCDRSFQDNLHNRKKHLNGLQHLKAKKLWYDMFRDAAAILLDEQNKRPCRKFLLTAGTAGDANRSDNSKKLQSSNKACWVLLSPLSTQLIKMHVVQRDRNLSKWRNQRQASATLAPTADSPTCQSETCRS
nr:zinc finger matrin-type protein 5 isoform X2 [Odocoileus virginianus texanus]